MGPLGLWQCFYTQIELIFHRRIPKELKSKTEKSLFDQVTNTFLFFGTFKQIGTLFVMFLGTVRCQHISLFYTFFKKLILTFFYNILGQIKTKTLNFNQHISFFYTF